MNTKNTINRGSELFRYLMATMVILASLLILPNTYARMGDVFIQDKIQYTVTSEGTLFKSVSVTGYETGITIANIPPFVIYNDMIYNVTTVANFAFQNCNSLVSVMIENGITSVGERAFAGCKHLSNVEIPDSITAISSFAFEFTCFTSIRLSKKLNSFGIGIFANNRSLEEIIIDEENEYFTSIDGVLFDKNQTTLLCYPGGKREKSYAIPSTVKTIRDGGFWVCPNLVNITIPDGVEKIKSYGFGECIALKSLHIPSSVVEIEAGAFRYCFDLQKITVDENNLKYLSDDGVLYNKDRTALICYPPAREGTSYIIPETVTELYNSAFLCANKLTYISIPKGVTSIKGQTFDSCSALMSIDIPIGITSIGDAAFIGCRSLASLEFLGDAPTVTNINAFEDTHITIYYIEGTSGWTNPWYGRPTVGVSITPTITAQPISRTVTEGNSVEFSVGVIGMTSFNYQWYKDGKMLSDATSASYRIDEVDRSDAGNYFVIVSNEYGTATSEIAVLTVNEGAAPEITVQPINKKVKVGTNVGFSVQASNATGYQWYKNGVAIEGATSRFLELNNVSKEDEGEYFAVASNKSGTAASKVVTLTVMIPPVIIKQPESLSVLEGTEAVFSVEAENATNYQWHKDNTIINGATNAVYAIDVTVKEDSGMYYVNVMHQDLVVKSKEARLEVYSLLVIIQQPESLSVIGGESATFTVKAENVTNINGIRMERLSVEQMRRPIRSKWSKVMMSENTV